MGIFKGGALRLFQTFLYALEFCCAAIILGIYSYFLSVNADRRDQGARITTQQKAIEGLSGAATLYLIFATLLTCCLGGVSVFAFLAIILDILFIGAMIAIAVMTRHNGTTSCDSGLIVTPINYGLSNTDGSFNDQITYAVSPKTACRLNKVCFAVSIIAAFLFLVTAALQVLLVRHHKKEKRYGPSPSNNYTSGFAGGKFWQRKNKNVTGNARDTEMAAGGLAVPAQDLRGSHETGYTGTTVNDKVEGAHTGYHTQPTGTAANPYGYERGTATNY